MWEIKVIWASLLCCGISDKTLRFIDVKLKKVGATWQDFWQQPTMFNFGMELLSESKLSAIKDFKQRFDISGYSDYLRGKDVNLLSLEDEDYPVLLKYAPDYPQILYARGQVSQINKQPLAVVGTRKPTHYGREVVDKLVSELVATNFTIVSGFMYGIDTLAQERAVKVGGKTIAFLGYGFDRVYPAYNRGLWQQFLESEQGFFSEYPPWQHGSTYSFPRRNRLVAGSSYGVLVVEAAAKSGSMITAGLAGDYGREVMAVPGSITSPYSEGTKRLLNDGATLVSGIDDILNQLAAQLENDNISVLASQDQLQQVSQIALTEKWRDCSEFEKQILNLLKEKSLDVDQLSETLKAPVEKLLSTLSILELTDLITKRESLYALT
ncbi:MAG: DNA-processing protein DprA [Pseudomonadales bacterium]|jgi:DNA processing protein|nr:DNA-processing protein DprA [Pseudomonadales bacterium]